MTRSPASLRVAALVVALLSPATLFAQARLTGADLQGTVSDATGGVLPGATVTVANVETGLVRTAVADQEGRYRVPALPPGTYRVSAVLDGFAVSTREGLVLVLGQLAAVDFALTVAGGESVTVTDVGPLVDARNTAVSTVVGSQQMATFDEASTKATRNSGRYVACRCGRRARARGHRRVNVQIRARPIQGLGES